MATQVEDEDKDITRIEDFFEDIEETTGQESKDSDRSTKTNDDKIRKEGKESPVMEAATSDMSVIVSLDEDASDSVKTVRTETESQAEFKEINISGFTPFKTPDIQCEPCFASKNAQKSPSGYCKECEEFLCNSCQKKHPKFRMFKDHRIIPAEEAIAMQFEPSKMCEQCAVQNISKEAKHFCPICEDLLLCETCAQCHRSLKSTKMHVLKDVSTFCTGEEKKHIYCDPCEMEDVASVACMFCPECENEAMCEQCIEMHRAQKKTRMHKLFDISQLSLNKPTSKGQQNEPIANLFCEMCEVQGKKIEAVSICDDCGTYPICAECRNVHTLQKATRYHSLRDIQSSDKNEYAKFLTRKYCEICLDQQRCTFMKAFCVDCEQCLCNDCIYRHEIQPITRSHRLVLKYSSTTKDTQYCKVCQIQGMNKKGIAVCQDCDNEFLCVDCVSYHKVQKCSRGHHIENIEDPAIEEMQANTINCDICKLQDKDDIAVAVCKICDESALCESCLSYHKIQKVTSGHRIHSIQNSIKIPKRNTFDDCVKTSTTCREPKTTMESKEEKAFYVQPGQPVVSNIGSDFLTLAWTKPERFESNDSFQVSLMDINLHQNKWRVYAENVTKDNIHVTGLKSASKYKFKVRSGDDGLFSADSEVIETMKSPASSIINFAFRYGHESNSPQSYAIPLTELKNARNERSKTRKFEIGPRPKRYTVEKTIILLGETGTGKSTLVDGMANYILGIHWEDPFRLKVINLEGEETEKAGNQAMSQTEWITCYTLHPMEGGRFTHTINIIDTPGFGDTRGLERDQEVVQQIRNLFSSKGPDGVLTIDAVCFLMKAPDARLTPMQSYIFQSVMSLFGKDIKENICSLITFADGTDPPVISALIESGLPFGQHFNFNNSGLFAKNSNIDAGSLAPMFWKMGMNSFGRFFEFLVHLPTKSLQLTSHVLLERNRMEVTVKNLQQKLDIGLMKIDQLKTEMKIFDENEALIANNKNFKYTVEVTQQRKKDLPKGEHVTNCLNCNFTCHENCRISDDDKKFKCSAMDESGKCQHCPDNCHWQEHKNSKYVFYYVPVQEQKTYADMQKKYEEASGKLPTQKRMLEKMQIDLNEMTDTVEEMMDIIRKCNVRLGEIALRPNPLSMVEHIDLMIENEQMQQTPGWMKRISMLREIRRGALITSRAETFHHEAKQLGARGNKKNNIFKRIKSTFKF